MKNLSNIVEAQKVSKINVGSNTINYISDVDLKKYLEIANKALSVEAKYVIQYLIDNNKTYMSDLYSDEDNVLAGFFNAGRQAASNKELWDNIFAVVKSNRIYEIPVFMTQADFKAVINKEKPAERIILRLDTPKGEEFVAKQYQPLMHKIVNQYIGKSNFSPDDLMGAAHEGLVYAMRNYGKKSKKTKGDDESLVKGTFAQYAAWMIRAFILDAIKNESHTVRIAISQQRKEKAATGKNIKSNTVSGDKVVGHGEDGNKSLFDFMGEVDDATANLDREDLENAWNKALELLEKHFDKKTMDIFYSAKGLKNHEKIQGKKLAEKYGCAPSQITYFCNTVTNYILKNKEILNLFKDVYELMHECQNDIDRNNSEGPYYINMNQRNISIDE